MKRLSLLCAGGLAAAALVVPASAGASITGLPEVNPGPIPVLPAQPPATRSGPEGPFSPTIGASWAGVFDLTVSPPDTNGAIGPGSYAEIINLQLAIYTRTGTLINKTALGTLTGHSQFNLSDPMILWDPNTQRFYYNVWDTVSQTMAWGFSKTSSPTGPASFCKYTSGFGYSAAEFPDYPKLGQSAGFLFIGVNHYPTSTAPRSDRSDLLWIDKPQGSAVITTCPVASMFKNGIFKGLKNQNGTQAFTPVPAIEDDASSNGYVVASSDIECPPTCGSGNLITLYVLQPSPTNPKVPVIVATHSLTVATYTSPLTAGAPQKLSSNTLDTLDGRLEHTVAAVDPAVGNVVVWTGHNVLSSGGRTEFRYYEINPFPLTSPSVFSHGVVSSPSLYVFNGAVAPDRTVTTAGAAHGNAIVIGFTTSSSTTFAADQMVSKIGTNPLSPFVLVHQSTTADSDFTCAPKCRWGDYGGATSDPAQSLTAAHGEVWLTNEAVTQRNNTTWNWEAKP
jgi:hypothetical protein